MPRPGRYVRTRDALGRTYYRDRVGGGFVPRATWERERNVAAHPPPFPVGVEVPGVPRGDPPDYDEGDWVEVDGAEDYE